eukprot:TRINITY_DN44872_c0_g1_i1.p1 TRINITY_DN44872_c0_g1~~TRINITY_DN44872_c0_g1_i1.p1  ORF type:complete len:220 (+),score=60.72 TRINITY_DN44872_c0_g1_i1:88-660(+)
MWRAALGAAAVAVAAALCWPAEQTFELTARLTGPGAVDQAVALLGDPEAAAALQPLVVSSVPAEGSTDGARYLTERLPVRLPACLGGRELASFLNTVKVYPVPTSRHGADKVVTLQTRIEGLGAGGLLFSAVHRFEISPAAGPGGAAGAVVRDAMTIRAPWAVAQWSGMQFTAAHSELLRRLKARLDGAV